MTMGKSFSAFMVYHSISNLFLQIMALWMGNVSLQQCFSKTVTTNSHILLKTQKFSPTDVFLYALIFMYMCIYVTGPGKTGLMYAKYACSYYDTYLLFCICYSKSVNFIEFLMDFCIIMMTFYI